MVVIENEYSDKREHILVCSRHVVTSRCVELTAVFSEFSSGVLRAFSSAS